MGIWTEEGRERTTTLRVRVGEGGELPRFPPTQDLAAIGVANGADEAGHSRGGLVDAWPW